MGKKSKRRENKPSKPRQKAADAPSQDPVPRKVFGGFSVNPNPNCLHGAPPDDETIIEPKSGDPLCVVRRRAMKQFMGVQKKIIDGLEQDGMSAMTSLMKKWAPYNIMDELIVKALFAEAVKYTVQDSYMGRTYALMSAVTIKYYVQAGPEKWKEGTKSTQNYQWIGDMAKDHYKIASDSEWIRLLNKNIPCDCVRELKRDIKAGPHAPVVCSNCRKVDIEGIMLTCTCCKCVFYCNEQCQLAHWAEHKHLCKIVRHNKAQTKKENAK